jgi:hypothetical protein
MASEDAGRIARPMVRWYSPRQLLRTLGDVLSSSIIVRVLDPRPLERESESLAVLVDWRSKDEAWFDFVADTGDGWNSTFSVARTLARAELPLVDPAQHLHKTRRADALILGGDLVYPTPRGESYAERLELPFAEALAKAPAPGPIVLAIPGNHDWYDGLRAFSSRFCRPNAYFAAWRVRQTRSYFAIALPGNWWVLAIDTQLGEELDQAQLRYFESVVAEMARDSRVVLVMPQPDWMHLRVTRRETRRTPSEQIEDLLAKKADLCLSGDLHHYRRFSAREPGEPARPRITCGGGGAFLHPTDAPLDGRMRDRLEVAASYPPPEESRRYRKRLLLFPFLNWSFGSIPALLYGLVALAGVADTDSLAHFAKGFLPALCGSVSGAAALLAFTVPIVAFRQRGDLLSFALACSHAVVQLAALFGLCSVGVLLAGATVRPQWQLPAVAIFVGVTGWLVGSLVFGGYLWISVVCGRLLDLAYAALRIEDWKSFLRIRSSSDGTLTVFPIGLRRVARTWRRRAQPNGELKLEPEDDATPPELIEMPIELHS